MGPIRDLRLTRRPIHLPAPGVDKNPVVQRVPVLLAVTAAAATVATVAAKRIHRCGCGTLASVRVLE